MISFPDRMTEAIRHHKISAHARPRRAWTMANPAKTFDWRAQFDDAKVRSRYRESFEARGVRVRIYLFAAPAKDIDLAGEDVRFAEDQFVVWEHPPTLKSARRSWRPSDWITPCSTEQYAMFEPISGSSAFMIFAYLARSIRPLTRCISPRRNRSATRSTGARQYHHGRYPTRMIAQIWRTG